MSEREGFLSRWSRLKRDATEQPEAASDEAVKNAETIREGENPEGENLEGENLEGENLEGDMAQSGGGAADKDATLQSIDLTELPPIESITATTDIRAFLAPGVPLELTRAALRRAWVVDPKIRSFIGIAENQWDFTAPETIPGFGPLKAIDDVRRLVADVFGDSSHQAQTEDAQRSDHVAETHAQLVSGARESAGSLTSEGTRESTQMEPPEEGEAAQLVNTASPSAVSAEFVHRDNHAASHNTVEHHESVTASRPRRHGGALPK
jgi:hypothetical protein